VGNKDSPTNGGKKRKELTKVKNRGIFLLKKHFTLGTSSDSDSKCSLSETSCNQVFWIWCL